MQTMDGQQFALLPLEDWRGFTVGNDNDFEQEVNATTANRALMAFLASRQSNEKRIPLEAVKEQLELN
ncbi:MAG TPA: hypothetical protein ENJ31_06530 [Anaerolineae bacterium]|nr:hypothetical protein [Anaerolineae bacterium]